MIAGQHSPPPPKLALHSGPRKSILAYTGMPGDGAKARWFSSTTKRYFTIDFNAQLFFYAHSESDKTVSHPIRFKDNSAWSCGG